MATVPPREAMLSAMQRRGLHMDPQMANVYGQLAGMLGG